MFLKRPFYTSVKKSDLKRQIEYVDNGSESNEVTKQGY
jgi:hypothetical protein